MFQRRRASFRSLVVFGALAGGWLAYQAWNRHQLEVDARAEAINACNATGTREAECTKAIEANSSECFSRTYTPASKRGKYGPRTPEHFDVAGYRACVLGPAAPGR